MLRLMLLVLVLTGPFGCASMAFESSLASPVSDSNRESAPAGFDARMIIRTASLDLIAENPGEAVSGIEKLVGAAGGHVSDGNIDEENAWLTVRVPAGLLDAFLDDVAALGEEERRSLTGTDVTDAYSDITAEIGNLASLRDRLRLLLDRANTIEEVLQVERELTRVQTQLDALTARKEKMSTDLKLSAVSISISERKPERVLGPLLLVYEGTVWIVTKLFVISP